MNLVPLNLQEEKKKFFFDPNYNPQFVYEEEISSEELYKYGNFGGELVGKAKAICDAVISKWGTESEYLDKTEGKILTREQATTQILEYLAECGVQNKVSLRFSANFIARTKIEGYTMNVRLPIEYREKSLRGVLHHEIGTHVFRRINEEKQVWATKRREFKLQSYLETEEGIALLQSGVDSEFPFFWRSAIQYLACFWGATGSFSQVYENLRQYIDKSESRFYYTLRAKRGMTDTSEPGGYTKDQVYMRGAVKVAKWLRDNEFAMSRLYLGKISIEDLIKVELIQHGMKLDLPPFMIDDKKKYKERLKEIIKSNNL